MESGESGGMGMGSADEEQAGMRTEQEEAKTWEHLFTFGLHFWKESSPALASQQQQQQPPADGNRNQPMETVAISHLTDCAFVNESGNVLCLVDSMGFGCEYCTIGSAPKS